MRVLLLANSSMVLDVSVNTHLIRIIELQMVANLRDDSIDSVLFIITTNVSNSKSECEFLELEI